MLDENSNIQQWINAHRKAHGNLGAALTWMASQRVYNNEPYIVNNKKERKSRTKEIKDSKLHEAILKKLRSKDEL